MPVRPDYVLSAEWFALTPAAAIIEWIRVPDSQGIVLGSLIVVHTAAAMAFWLSIFTEVMPQIVLIASGATLGVLWIVNVYRAYSTPSLFEGSSSSTLYYNVVRLFSLVSFVLVAPLWGRPRPAIRYGKWLLIAANVAVAFIIVGIVIVAEPYWEAWGCYGGHVPVTLKYQKHGMCGSAPIYKLGRAPICGILAGRDHSDPSKVDGQSCDQRSDDIFLPFRHTIKWCIHFFSVSYSAYVVATLREQTPHALHTVLKNAAKSVLSKI